METKRCKDCDEIKELSEFHKLEKWYRNRCKKCHNAKYQPATGKQNIGRFKKGDIPPKPFKKGHLPWNKDKKGYHLKPKHPSMYRKKAFAIYENECEGCKRTDDLHAHHIDGDHENASEENLMIVCNICHPRIHSLCDQGFDHFQSVIILRNYHKWMRKDK